jgi:hypothetical protein
VAGIAGQGFEARNDVQELFGNCALPLLMKGCLQFLQALGNILFRHLHGGPPFYGSVQ